MNSERNGKRMKAKKWIFQKHKYIDIEVDDRCNYLPLTDMEQVVVCPNCGKEIPVGDTYTSHEYYSSNGIWGLNVCPKCYQDDLKRYYADQGRK